MKSVSLALSTLLLCPTFNAYASKQIVPAGSLINCTVAEAKLSSKTSSIGDPVLCSLGITTRNGSARLPFDSYLEGRFEDYKDPGHLVGKGWMELKFDRIVVEPRTVIPVSARVVSVPGYDVDQLGRVLGKGHRTRDIVLWTIPILWPIDLINLPRRGPRPTLKAETRLVVKVMDDMEVPITDEPDQDPSSLYRRPTAFDDVPAERPSQQYAQNDPAEYQPPPAPVQRQQSAQEDLPEYQLPSPPVQQQYAPPAPVLVYLPVIPVYMAAPAPVYYYAPPPVPMYSPPVVSMYTPPRVAFDPNQTTAYRPYGPYMPYGYGH
jgi:hypothetical protein